MNETYVSKLRCLLSDTEILTWMNYLNLKLMEFTKVVQVHLARKIT